MNCMPYLPGAEIESENNTTGECNWGFCRIEFVELNVEYTNHSYCYPD